MKLIFVVFWGMFWLQSMGAEYTIFQENGKVGLKNETGDIILPPDFEALGWSDGSFSVTNQVTGYKNKNQWGLINLKKKFLTKAEYELINYTDGDRIIAGKRINPFTVKLGCLDLTGKTIVPFRYDGIKINGLRAIVFNKNGTQFEYGLIDLNDKSVIPLKFKKITSLGTLRYAVESFDNKIALFTEEGNKLTDFAIDSLSSFYKSWSIIYQNYKQGLLNRDGEIKIEAKYREIKINEDGSVAARLPDTWKLIDQQKNEKDLFEADELILKDDHYRINKSGKTGILDKEFEIKIPAQYDYIGPLIFGKAVAKKNGKFGLLRSNHSVVLPFLFDSLVLEGRLVRVKDLTAGTKRWMLLDTLGVQKSNYYDFIDKYNGRFFPVRNKNFYGGIDAFGKEIIHCVYDSILQFKDEKLVVKFKGKQGIISITENWLLTPQNNSLTLAGNDLFFEKQDAITFLKNLSGETIYFTSNKIEAKEKYLLETFANGGELQLDFNGRIITSASATVDVEKIYEESEGFRGIRRDGKYGFIDSQGRLRVANRYEAIGFFKEGLASVKILGKWGYVNKFDKIVINPSYEQTDEFSYGSAIVKRNGKFGLVDKEGKVILATRYDQLEPLQDKILLTQNNLKGLADRKGNVLIEPRFEQLEIIDTEKVLVVSHGKYGVLSTYGYNLLPMIYDQLIFIKDKNAYLALKKAEWSTLE